jgi:hypothetical protein
LPPVERGLCVDHIFNLAYRAFETEIAKASENWRNLRAVGNIRRSSSVRAVLKAPGGRAANDRETDRHPLGVRNAPCRRSARL